jgi:hypothetical protein
VKLCEDIVTAWASAHGLASENSIHRRVHNFNPLSLHSFQREAVKAIRDQNLRYVV